MSDNDTISRKEAVDSLFTKAHMNSAVRENGEIHYYLDCYEAMDTISALPAVPHEMTAREALFTRRLNDIIDKLQEQADIHNERAKELLNEEDGQVSQYTWAVSLRETYRRVIRSLDDLLCEAEKQ